jgi:hypothetical protein
MVAASYSLTHRDVPRDVPNNLAWRIAVREWAMQSRQNQQALRYWCSQDVRLFILGFCWLIEPREDRKRGKHSDKIIPFILWPHQEPALDLLLEHIGLDDIGFDKSRGEGASWLVLMVFLWLWLYKPTQFLGLVSRNELAVDNPDDPDSLMTKLDWALSQLPGWMVPRHDRNTSKHTLFNLQNGSSIVGYSATGDVARGGRKTAFLMDEIASFAAGEDQAAMNSTQHVTNCRILISTPKGPFGVFYEAMRGMSDMVKISLRWQSNPTKNAGMYRIQQGRVYLSDWEYWRERCGNKALSEHEVKRLAYNVADETDNNPFRYRFMLKGPYVREGKERSPWYDTQCRRPGATPRGIAQELDLDYSGANAMFFDIGVLTGLQDTTCWPAPHVGDLLFVEHPEDLSLRWSQRPGGSLLVWCPIIPGAGPPKDRDYVIGADIGSGLSGTSTSNSVLSAIDLATAEQVAEFASPAIQPEKLAWYAYALSHWFTGPGGCAMIVPEVNGTWGVAFVKFLQSLGFGKIYRRDAAVLDKSSKKASKIGFYADKTTKPLLLQELNYALGAGELKARSRITLEEAKSYILGPDGVPVHIDSMTSEDPSGAKGNHGDRVTALALAWRGRRDSAIVRSAKPKEPQLNAYSIGGRATARRRAEQESSRFVW